MKMHQAQAPPGFVAFVASAAAAQNAANHVVNSDRHPPPGRRCATVS